MAVPVIPKSIAFWTLNTCTMYIMLLLHFHINGFQMFGSRSNEHRSTKYFRFFFLTKLEMRASKSIKISVSSSAIDLGINIKVTGNINIIEWFPMWICILSTSCGLSAAQQALVSTIWYIIFPFYRSSCIDANSYSSSHQPKINVYFGCEFQ